MTDSALNPAYTARIQRVLDHIQRNLREPLSPVTLAPLAGLSLHHFHRVFRGIVGESVMGHVRRCRLEQAARQLKFSDAPVQDIAGQIGYPHPSAFTRAFQARFGEPPSAFRADSRPAVLPAVSVRLERWPAQALVCLRHVGPYAAVGSAWEALAAWGAPRGLLPSGAGTIGLCYDDPEVTPPDQLRYDACLAVARPVAPPAPLYLRTLPAGRYAVAEHVGPMERILATYLGLLGRWLPRQPEALAPDPVVERYHTPFEITEPAAMRTQVCVRIAEHQEHP